MENNSQLKIGLALAGGGTYAIFQVGVLDVLTDKKKAGYLLGKKVKAITGTSGGAINAVFAGIDNMSLKRLKEFWKENNISMLLKISSELIHNHYERSHQMSLEEIKTNDVDESSLVMNIPSNEFLVDILLSASRSIDKSDIGRNFQSSLKFAENLTNTFFPFLKSVNDIPKRQAQKMVRIYLREVLAKHLLTKEQLKDKTGSYSRIKSVTKNEASHTPISIFIGATNIKKSIDHFFTSLALNNGKYVWKFAGDRYRYGISVESILACTNIPYIFPAKRLHSTPLFDTLGYDAEAEKLFYKKRLKQKGHWADINEEGKETDKKEEGVYWDGYFLSNPSLEPLVRLNCVEILLIRLASVEHDNIPFYEEEIENRKEILIQNVATQREVQQIRLQNEHMEHFQEYLPDKKRTKFIRLHEIRFKKETIIEQVFNDPAQSDEFMELGKQAGKFFKKAYNNLEKIIEKNHLNLSPDYCELVVTCNYDTNTLHLKLRDCVTDHTYRVEYS